MRLAILRLLAHVDVGVRPDRYALPGRAWRVGAREVRLAHRVMTTRRHAPSTSTPLTVARVARAVGGLVPPVFRGSARRVRPACPPNVLTR
jgi:hypothetical protein